MNFCIFHPVHVSFLLSYIPLSIIAVILFHHIQLITPPLDWLHALDETPNLVKSSSLPTDFFLQWTMMTDCQLMTSYF